MYILKIGNGLLIKEIAEDIVLTKNYTQAIQYKTIGDAMRDAVKLNDLIGHYIIKVISYG